MDVLMPLFLHFFGGGGGGGSGGFRGGRRLGRRQQGNTPMNNIRQNAQFNDVVRELGLSKDEANKLHRAISGEGFGFREIMEVARDLFGLREE